MKLTPENCPNVSQKRLDAVNALSDEELRLEIEKGRTSRFGVNLQPVLRTALSLRENELRSNARSEDLEIARDRNEIAKEALREAKEANSKADSARLWSAIAVLVTVLLALFSYFTAQ